MSSTQRRRNLDLLPGEPSFILRAMDPLAPWAVRQWAFRAQESGIPQARIDIALALAVEMEEWARTNKIVVGSSA